MITKVLSIFENFKGNGKYSEPEFVWFDPVAPTGLTFLDSDELGKDYENDHVCWRLQ